MVVSRRQDISAHWTAVCSVAVLAATAISCGTSQPAPTSDVSVRPTPSPTAVAEVKVTNEAGRYADYIAKKPIPAIYKPYDPKLLFYALYVNCAGCHDFVTELAEVKDRLEKNSAYGSIQDRISTGSMPPNKPNFATSAEGKELLSLLNSL
ncbi:MAG: hypothetical protein RL189_1524 [Pseudomonadota bacterium]|jgi:hypothetical protein